MYFILALMASVIISIIIAETTLNFEISAMIFAISFTASVVIWSTAIAYEPVSQTEVYSQEIMGKQAYNELLNVINMSYETENISCLIGGDSPTITIEKESYERKWPDFLYKYMPEFKEKVHVTIMIPNSQKEILYDRY